MTYDRLLSSVTWLSFTLPSLVTDSQTGLFHRFNINIHCNIALETYDRPRVPALSALSIKHSPSPYHSLTCTLTQSIAFKTQRIKYMENEKLKYLIIFHFFDCSITSLPNASLKVSWSVI